MDVGATVFRKNLFQMLDRALQGEQVEIVYKGSRLRLLPRTDQSKLARAVRRHALRVDPQSIVESDSRLMAGLERGWKRDDKSL
jgi:antitoxin (DNA-binding transcriptional repressor) of toxin-antitoxin stability system